MEIKIIKNPISKKEIIDVAKDQFGDLLKAVVDIKQVIMAIACEMHADGEAMLMEKEGSKREDIWGINLYLKKEGEELIEFDSMINIKPSYGNRSRDVESSEIKEKIKTIVDKLILD